MNHSTLKVIFLMVEEVLTIPVEVFIMVLGIIQVMCNNRFKWVGKMQDNR
jgi:hypothetical protein